MRRPMIQTPALTLLSVMCLTTAVYWIGLRGPFLFDDHQAFEVLQAWAQGKATLRDVVMGNTSIFMHRGLAMASFALNTKWLGFNPYSFKLGNLLIHLLTGLAALAFLLRLFKRDRALRDRAPWLAVAIAGIWLLHPLNASTVLYAVQRMAQISALLILVGLWTYIAIRDRIERDPSPTLWVLLGLSVATATIAAIQGKQTGAILPALCLLVELVYYKDKASHARPLIAFYGLFLAVPLVIGVIAFVSNPDTLTRAYGDYAFSPWQRLISEARVLCEYLRTILLPYTPSMGVYTDDYVASKSLISPPTTLFASLAIVILSALAASLWRSLPSVAFGWFFFLLAHAIEGTIIPIELYYEHRNYLPMFGILIAVSGILSALTDFGARRGFLLRRRVAYVAVAALLTSLALQTHGRARVWSDPEVLAESALENHPKSARAVLTYLGTALDAGDNARAYAVANKVINGEDARLSGLISLFKVRMDCVLTGRGSTSDVQKAVSALPRHVDLNVALMFRYVGVVIGNETCEGISRSQIADAMVAVADRATTQPDNAQPKLMLRHGAAVFYAKDANWAASLAQAQLAWSQSTELPAIRQLVETLLAANRVADAQSVVAEARRRARSSASEEDRRQLDVLELAISQARAANLAKDAARPPSGSSRE